MVAIKVSGNDLAGCSIGWVTLRAKTLAKTVERSEKGKSNKQMVFHGSYSELRNNSINGMY
jgi:hypothetical protein